MAKRQFTRVRLEVTLSLPPGTVPGKVAPALRELLFGVNWIPHPSGTPQPGVGEVRMTSKEVVYP